MKRFVRALALGLGIALVVVLVGPFLIPTGSMGTVPAEQLADPDSQFVELNGLRVHYKALGQGDATMLLLHGFGASLYSWHEVMPALGKDHRVVAYDRPGFGLTARPLPGEWEGDSPYGAEAQVELVVALLDQLGIGRAVLVGHSAGGAIAMLTAIRYPQRVRALILVAPAVYTGGGLPAWVRPLAQTPQGERVGLLLARSLSVRGQTTLREAWHDPNKITPAILEGYQKPLQVENWDTALWQLTLASHPLKLGEQLERVPVRSLVITGDDDRIVPIAGTVRLASNLSGTQLVIVPQCGHLPHEEAPANFLTAVRNFLLGLDRP
jgi:pimeloyl-ACP methyl ester carboxylesterase